jgi:hypothetical protein
MAKSIEQRVRNQESESRIQEKSKKGTSTQETVSRFAEPVIPESAARGCPESRKNNSLLDTGSRLRLVRYDDCCDFWGFSTSC